MSVDVVDALSGGVRRTAARNGLVFVGIVYTLRVLAGLFGPRQPAGGTAAPGSMPGDAPAISFPDPVVAVPALVATFVAFLATLATLVVAIGAIRTFVSDERDRLPEGVFTRRLGRTFLNVFLGSVVFGIAAAIGFALLVVPGILVLATLGFWVVLVVEEDENFVEGLRDSWALTSDDRLRLSLVVLVVLVVGVPVNLFFALVGIGLGNLSPLLGVLVGQVGNAFVTVFSLATLAATYRQLSDATGDEADEEANEDADDEWKYDP